MLGVLLPVILPVGVIVFERGIGFPDTISGYVGTVMGGTLVGIVFAMGVFLYFYVGYESAPEDPDMLPTDKVATNLAAVFAIGVALLPVTTEVDLVRVLHGVSATLLFIMFAVISLWYFTRGPANPTPEKLTRNRVYRTSGIAILVSIALIGLYALLPDDTPIASIKPVFWLESTALWAFGWAWFVKGNGIKPLND